MGSETPLVSNEEFTKKCVKCNTIWPAHQLDQGGCISCKVNPHKKSNPIQPKRKVDKPKLKQTLGLVMHTALPKEIQ